MLELLTEATVTGESLAQLSPLQLSDDGLRAIGGGLAVGLAALGTGVAQRSIGAAAVGSVVEDSDNLAYALLFTVIPETLVIIGFITIFLL